MSHQKNILAIQGIEFVEYTTTQPLALGAFLERAGFVPIARHRSREVLLYRQGGMNVIVNAAADAPFVAASAVGATHVGAVAFRVKNAAAAHSAALQLGAWDIPRRAREMELNIPGIRGPGDSEFYFVDRVDEFSIYDVDFVPLQNDRDAARNPSSLAFFGIVQLVLPERLRAWEDFYASLFGFSTIAPGQFFGVVNKGELMQSPCNTFMWQLIEPPPEAIDVQWHEALVRIGVGSPDVAATKAQWERNGISFLPVNAAVDGGTALRGAVTEITAGGACIELVLAKPISPVFIPTPQL
jgi:4-hydroxyphenylpyruvate dioxygenase